MKEDIRKFIIDEFMNGEGAVSDDEKLFDSGIIDSLGFNSKIKLNLRFYIPVMTFFLVKEQANYLIMGSLLKKFKY